MKKPRSKKKLTLADVEEEIDIDKDPDYVQEGDNAEEDEEDDPELIMPSQPAATGKKPHRCEPQKKNTTRKKNQVDYS